MSKINAPKVYIDCEFCDLDFIKTEISYVNYVIDRTFADIYVLITTQETGADGSEYTIIFIGRNDYKRMSDTLKFISSPFDTEDTIRRDIVKKLKVGLMRYLANTPVIDDISITVIRKPHPRVVEDKWHNWAFSINLNTSLSGEESRNSNSLDCSITANRTTEEWKTQAQLHYHYNKSSFRINDTTIIKSFTKTYGSSGSVVKSINDHWSVGAELYVSSSTYGNKKISYNLWPAIEYAIFPYSQTTNRKLSIFYRTGYVYYEYREETIYDKMREGLFYEAASITLDVKQKWGSMSTTLYGSHYFHDFTKHKLTIHSSLSFPALRGLFFNISGQVSMIHDQLSLPKQDLTSEEILLQMKELATQYDYYLTLGLTYSFGSCYSNVVNPRFGN